MAQSQAGEMTRRNLDSFCFAADSNLHHKEVQVLSADFPSCSRAMGAPMSCPFPSLGKGASQELGTSGQTHPASNIHLEGTRLSASSAK